MRRTVIDSTQIPKSTGRVKPRNPIEEKEGQLVRIYTIPSGWARLLGEAKSLSKGKALKVALRSANADFIAFIARKKKLLTYMDAWSTYFHYRPDLKGATNGNSAT